LGKLYTIFFINWTCCIRVIISPNTFYSIQNRFKGGRKICFFFFSLSLEFFSFYICD
jgi:hypothetical protein